MGLIARGFRRKCRACHCCPAHELSPVLNEAERARECASDQMLTRAIIVAGHAVFLGGPDCPPAEVTNDSNWTLLPYQKGEPHFYAAHIRAALDLAAQDPSALVIFSGGFTRKDAPNRSEAQGYSDVASALGLIDKAHAWTLEESARDSFDNCLFGIARFAQATGKLPEQVTVVSWEFKSARFEQHMETLLFPPSKYTYVGVGMPDDSAAAISGENATLKLFATDRAGYGPVLGEKKKARNPFQNAEPYSAALPHLADLLAYRGSGKAPGPICPWVERKQLVKISNESCPTPAGVRNAP